MPRSRCPNGTRKNKNKECVEYLPSTIVMTSSSNPRYSNPRYSNPRFSNPRVGLLSACVRSKKTNRCKMSAKKNASSSTCTYFRGTQRCRSVKAEEKFVEYQNYKVKGDVKNFLQKKVATVALKDLIERAKKNSSYDDTIQFVFENPRKTESQIKKEFESEILELAYNYVRDKGDRVVTLKSVKYVLNNNSGFGFLLE